MGSVRHLQLLQQCLVIAVRIFVRITQLLRPHTALSLQTIMFFVGRYCKLSTQMSASSVSALLSAMFVVYKK